MSKSHKMKQALIIKSELKKMNILIITGGDHPYKETTPILNELIISQGHNTLISETAEELTNKNFEFDVIVMNSLRQKKTNNDFTQKQKESFENQIKSGIGLVSIHISAASCPDWKRIKDITGGGWVLGESWHPPFGWFKVFIDQKKHPITNGVDDFWTYDECYCGLEIKENIDIFMHGKVDNEIKPLGWTLEYGKGKVSNIALGHSSSSQSHPMFQKLITNSIEHVSP